MHRDLPSFAHDLRLAERDRVLARRHVHPRLLVVELRLHEDHRVVATDRAGKQPLRIERIRRAHDLQPWNVREERLGRLRVIVPASDTAANRHAHDHRRRVLAAGAIPELGQLVHDLIEGGIDVVPELDLWDRPQPVQGHPDRGADDARTQPAAYRCSGPDRTLPEGRRWRETRRRTDRRPRPARRCARPGASRPSARRSRPGRGSSPAWGRRLLRVADYRIPCPLASRGEGFCAGGATPASRPARAACSRRGARSRSSRCRGPAWRAGGGRGCRRCACRPRSDSPTRGTAAARG